MAQHSSAVARREARPKSKPERGAAPEHVAERVAEARVKETNLIVKPLLLPPLSNLDLIWLKDIFDPSVKHDRNLEGQRQGRIIFLGLNCIDGLS